MPWSGRPAGQGAGCRAWTPTALALVAAGLLASGCGSEASDRSGPFKPIEQNERAANQRALASTAPRWERVVTLRGSGDASKAVEIEPQAIQWRVRWNCRKGSFEVSRMPAPEGGKPLVSGRCPDDGRAVASNTGEFQLGVRTEGRWEMVVEQQVTDPLAEPLLPEMKTEDAEVVASADFYPVAKRGRGKAVLYEVSSGRLALRLEDFATTNNTDLFVWLSKAKRPRTTRQALGAERLELEPLKSTIGDQNYRLPKGLDADPIRSVVIWYKPSGIAYTAASFRQ